MKLAITIVLVTTIYASGQKANLDVVNPLPRVNDEIEVIVSVKSILKGESNQKPRDLILGTLKLRDLCLDTGLVTIGPFKLTVNNKEYETGELELKVNPELPLNIVDGLWVSAVTSNSRRYIVIEQRVSNRINVERNSNNEITINKSDGELLFAELAEEPLRDKGISILSIYSTSGKKIINLNDPYGSFTHKKTIYTYELTSEYKGEFKINKEYFKDFPSNIKINEILIE